MNVKQTETARGPRANYVQGTTGAAPPKRVIIPTQSRTIAGSFVAPPAYRGQPPPRCTALSRLETVADEKPDVGLIDIRRSASTTAQLTGDTNPRQAYRAGMGDKSRGLRHFSTKVCEKVKEKGKTNYNEVADELVAEHFDSLSTPPQSVDKQQYDMKNIRRRVYDALNVLMAMNIIQKEKKEIRWVGLPTSSVQECRRLEEDKITRQESIRKKTEQLQELIIQLVAFKTLVQRNRENERSVGRPHSSKVLFLPFIVINTQKDTVVDCSIASDKTEFLFHFDQPFEIHDDIEILKRLGLSYGLDKGDVPPPFREHIKNCLPPALRDYADQIIDGNLTLPMPPVQPPSVQKLIAAPGGVAPAERKVIRPIVGANSVRGAVHPNNRYTVPVKTVVRPRQSAGHATTTVTSSQSYRNARASGAGQPYILPSAQNNTYRTNATTYVVPNPGRVPLATAASSNRRYLQQQQSGRTTVAPPYVTRPTEYSQQQNAQQSYDQDDEIIYEGEYQEYQEP
uniref:Transcription factor Dp-1 n=1 Tax=Panagrellus redivivus TaxID=6233 RepID=A0A7E4ZQ47_PANRE